MAFDPDIADKLLSCEQDGSVRPYGEPVVRLDSEGRDVIVVSDLHLASGRGVDGRTSGLENFFFDAAFERFLRVVGKKEHGKGPILVINGDFIDFLRITTIPRSELEFEEWHSLLKQLGIPQSIRDLKDSISKKERTFGLKTYEHKSVYRVSIAVRGHAHAIFALAEWLLNGGRIAIVKGNHDLEWSWPGVRNYFRLALAQCIQKINGDGPLQVLNNAVLPNVMFANAAIVIDKTFFIEHGHRYDKFSHVVGPALLKGGKEINLPFGSFFNRYLINRIELLYPFIDNVRPRENLLPLLFKEHFFLGVRVFFQHIPFMMRMIPKCYYRYMFSRFLLYAIPGALVVGMIAAGLFLWLQGGGSAIAEFFSTKIGKIIANPLQIFAGAGLSYVFVRMVAFFHLKEAESLAEDARKKFKANKEYRFVVFGHTHNPDHFIDDDRRFWNSGTWIPIIEYSNGQVRNDKTFTVVHMGRDANGNFVPQDLQRWNDDAGRLEDLPVSA